MGHQECHQLPITATNSHKCRPLSRRLWIKLDCLVAHPLPPLKHTNIQLNSMFQTRTRWKCTALERVLMLLVLLLLVVLLMAATSPVVRVRQVGGALEHIDRVPVDVHEARLGEQLEQQAHAARVHGRADEQRPPGTTLREGHLLPGR